VLDLASGKPLPDALVVSVDEFEYGYCYSGAIWSDVNSSTVVGLSGTAYLTDDKGETFIASPFRPRTLIAIADGRVERSTLEVHDRREQVIGVGQRQLEVEVVNKNGRPEQGVPIVLGGCAFEPGVPGACHAVSDANGRCVFSLLDLERSVHHSCGRRALVMLGFPCLQYALYPIDAKRLDPLRIQLPEWGQVTIDLQDDNGMPLSAKTLRDHHVVYETRAAKAGEPRGVTRESKGHDTQLVRGPCIESRIQLPRVAVGLKLSIRICAMSREFSGQRLVGSGETLLAYEDCVVGPKNPDDAVQVRLTIPKANLPIEAEEWAAPSLESRSHDDAGASVESTDRVSSLTIGVQCDVPIEFGRLRVRTRAEGSATWSMDLPGDETWLDVTGRATVRSVLPGRQTVAIFLSNPNGYGEGEILNEVKGIAVDPASMECDPRLMSIDLRSRIRYATTIVTDTDGRPVSGEVYRGRTGSPELQWIGDFSDGRVSIMSARNDARPVVFAAERFQPLSIDFDSIEGHVLMKRGYPIRVALDPSVELPRAMGGVKYYVGISELPRCGQLPNRQLEERSVRTVALAPGESASFEIPEPGERQVIVIRGTRESDGTEDLVRCDAADQTIVVQESSKVQSFTVKPRESANHDR